MTFPPPPRITQLRALRAAGHSNGCQCQRCLELRRDLLSSHKHWREVYTGELDAGAAIRSHKNDDVVDT